MPDMSTLVDQVICRVLVEDPDHIRHLDDLRFPQMTLARGLTISWEPTRLTLETRVNIPIFVGGTDVNFPAVAISGVDDIDVERIDHLVRSATGVDIPSAADQAVVEIAHHVDMPVGDVREVIRGMAAIDRTRSKAPKMWSEDAEDEPSQATWRADYSSVEWPIRIKKDEHGRRNRRGGVHVGAYNKAIELRGRRYDREAEAAEGILRLSVTIHGSEAMRRLAGTRRLATLRSMLEPPWHAFALGRAAHQLRLGHDVPTMPVDFAGRLRHVFETLDRAKLAGKSRPVLRETWCLAAAGYEPSEIAKRTGRGDDVYRDMERLRGLGLSPDGSDAASRSVAVGPLRTHLVPYLDAFRDGRPVIRRADLVWSPYLKPSVVRMIRTRMAARG